MGVNKWAFCIDFASFASVSVGGRWDNVCDHSGLTLNRVRGRPLLAASFASRLTHDSQHSAFSFPPTHSSAPNPGLANVPHRSCPCRLTLRPRRRRRHCMVQVGIVASIQTHGSRRHRNSYIFNPLQNRPAGLDSSSARLVRAADEPTVRATPDFGVLTTLLRVAASSSICSGGGGWGRQACSAGLAATARHPHQRTPGAVNPNRPCRSSAPARLRRCPAI